MKSTTFLTLFLLLFASKNFAQETSTPSYSKFVGGYLNINAGKNIGSYYPYRLGTGIINAYYYGTGNGKGFRFSIQPTFGKQINPKTVVGISPYIAFSKTNSVVNAEEEYRFLEYGLSLFTRHTVKSFGKLSILIEPKVFLIILIIKAKTRFCPQVANLKHQLIKAINLI
jgi:hypothetical protein